MVNEYDKMIHLYHLKKAANMINIWMYYGEKQNKTRTFSSTEISIVDGGNFDTNIKCLTGYLHGCEHCPLSDGEFECIMEKLSHEDADFSYATWGSFVSWCKKMKKEINKIIKEYK